jgi:hypothetical protein
MSQRSDASRPRGSVGVPTEAALHVARERITSRTVYRAETNKKKVILDVSMDFSRATLGCCSSSSPPPSSSSYVSLNQSMALGSISV